MVFRGPENPWVYQIVGHVNGKTDPDTDLFEPGFHYTSDIFMLPEEDARALKEKFKERFPDSYPTLQRTRDRWEDVR
jgi:hypothetical protein